MTRNVRVTNTASAAGVAVMGNVRNYNAAANEARRGKKASGEANRSRNELGEPLSFAATHSVERVCRKLGSKPEGLAPDIAYAKYELDGPNAVTTAAETPALLRLLSCFVSPFTLILLALAGISVVTDVILPAPGEKDPSTCILIAIMVLISGVLEFTQRSRSESAAASLANMVRSTCLVVRPSDPLDDPDGLVPTEREIPFSEVVVGDVVRLASGDMLPADCRVISAKDLFVNQAALTGESEPVEKRPDPVHVLAGAGGFRRPLAISDCSNLAFAGTTVQSGSATAVVVATGDNTYVGRMADALREPAPKTSFDEGLQSVSRVLVIFMLVMCPLVFFINGFGKGQWLDALLFSVSVAVGITPQMLPVIVSTCLARGGSEMARQEVIVKTPAAIQNLGAIDVLCTDKTGTITADKVVLERHLDVRGEPDDRVLGTAFLNSWFQTGLRNLIDEAIVSRSDELLDAADLRNRFAKVDEVPFDFERRRLSVVVADSADGGRTQMVTKGAFEEVLAICDRVELGGEVLPLTDEQRASACAKVDALNESGMRVVAVARKDDPRGAGEFGVADECNMILIGYLGFLDPPKPSAKAAVAKLRESGVAVKVLTGDNEGVAAAVCRKVDIDPSNMLSGSEVDALTDAELAERAEHASLFAKLSPLQKARVVRVLRERHAVGFMGDGINDASAMRASDVGISVDTAVDVARESADIILLKKDLLVLGRGIREGRKTYGNTIKYVKATASSNFGNVLSVVVASLFLPFLPMSALQLLLLGLAYTITCVALPWDNVDEDFLDRPRSWDARSITGFMLWIGPASSVFDILTFAISFLWLAPMVAGGSWAQLSAAGDVAGMATFVATFQTTWFIESMWTQTLVLLALRSDHLPYLGTTPAKSLTALAVFGVALVSVLPFVPGVAQTLGLVAPPLVFFGVVALLMVGYLVLVSIVKWLYIRRYGSLL